MLLQKGLFRFIEEFTIHNSVSWIFLELFENMGDKSISHFPDRPQFSGFMKPCRLEGEIRALEVHGEIPNDIDGTFYRVMPDPQLPPFIQDDPVHLSLFWLSMEHTVLTNSNSGSTETATSVPFKSKTAPSPFDSAMWELKNSFANVRLSVLC